MRTNLTKLTLFVTSFLLMAVLGAVFSLILSGVIGGISISIAPQASFRLLERYICPAGSDLQYREGVNPGSPLSAYTFDCVSFNRTVASNQTSHARAVLYESLFVLIFIPTFIVGTILMAVIFFR